MSSSNLGFLSAIASAHAEHVMNACVVEVFRRKILKDVSFNLFCQTHFLFFCVSHFRNVYRYASMFRQTHFLSFCVSHLRNVYRYASILHAVQACLSSLCTASVWVSVCVCVCVCCMMPVHVCVSAFECVTAMCVSATSSTSKKKRRLT